MVCWPCGPFSVVWYVDDLLAKGITQKQADGIVETLKQALEFYIRQRG